MEPTKEEEVKIIEITLRELEPVLRSELGNALIVESYTTKSFLLPGENYGSTILAVDAVIRRTEHDEKEDLHMIAKMPPPTEFQRRIFNSPFTFNKEILFYEDVFPAYRRLEKEYGIKENELFDILSKYYGSRRSLTPEIDFDDNAVILLENLKKRGYYTGKRSIGYDLAHSKLAVRAMARFHALGIAMRCKKPDVFARIKKTSECMKINMDEFSAAHLPVLARIKEDPITSVYHDRCEKILTDENLLESWFAQPEGPWATIIHSDFWVNNIMFHSDENGHVDDVKFVDFQNYVYSKPVRELIFYLHSSVDDDVWENHLEELVDLYYETFISVLKRIDCDVTPFAREHFDAQFPIDAKIEFVHLTFMIKVLTIDIEQTKLDNSTMRSVMTNYGGNEIYGNRLRRLILYFDQHGWI
ncbi:hypothetical protein KPH14_008939 [Odynerus spinipes]|uniref:CHK kinase-like domain-containing protein n=1 Tax=Odynerus spinipes TaxID=1348599 RepID=A0AAD9VR06_9HYME|nr:hypothetical protein KPH14_008939 [Odynerus spinipes]